MSYDCCEHEMIAYLILLYTLWLMQNLVNAELALDPSSPGAA